MLRKRSVRCLSIIILITVLAAAAGLYLEDSMEPQNPEEIAAFLLAAPSLRVMMSSTSQG